MATVELQKSSIVIPFVCPICAGANAVHLITLSRAGGMDCAVCGKWLRSTDVMRAMHSPRAARSPDAQAPRTHTTTAPAARPSSDPALRGTGARAGTSRRDAIPWPPTPESRAAAKPLVRRD